MHSATMKVLAAHSPHNGGNINVDLLSDATLLRLLGKWHSACRPAGAKASLRERRARTSLRKEVLPRVLTRRGVTGHLLFRKEHLRKLSGTFRARIAQVCQMWKDLTPEDRCIYNQRARARRIELAEQQQVLEAAVSPPGSCGGAPEAWSPFGAGCVDFPLSEGPRLCPHASRTHTHRGQEPVFQQAKVRSKQVRGMAQTSR